MNNKPTLLFAALLSTILLTGCDASATPSIPDEAPQTTSLETLSEEASLSDTEEAAFAGESGLETIESFSKDEAKAQKLPFIIMVNDDLYLYTGTPSDMKVHCGMMDGQITSEVPNSEIPSQNDQSNFGTGYGYQYGTGANIDVYVPSKASDETDCLHFVKENPVSEGNEDILLTSAPSMTLRNYLTDDLSFLTLRSGNYSWYYGTGNEITAQIACGSHPLDEANLHPSVLDISSYNTYYTPAFSFSFTGNLCPDSLTIQKWSRDDVGKPEARSVSTSTFCAPLPLLELETGYVYEITAQWKEENAAQNGCYGLASYVFITE